METMYIGLPIIATDCRGHRDLIKNNINGYLVEINDCNKFYDCIEEIYLSQDKYLKFGIESKKIIEKYLLKNIINKLKCIYFSN